MKTVLIITPYFPPSGEAAIYRTWDLFRYFGLSDIRAVVLTRDLRNLHPDNSFRLTAEQEKRIHRPFTINAKHDLSLFGKHLEIQALPDEWWIWKLFAVRIGKKLIEQYQPDVLWSTYPAISAHVVAMKLAKWSRLPWIADYQDPLMYHLKHREGLDTFKAEYNRSIDAQVIDNCDLAVFATQQAADLYKEIYPHAKSKFYSISNGYDEDAYNNILTHSNTEDKKYVLYSGVLYVGDSIRDPTPLFDAIQICKEQHDLTTEIFEMRFRGAGDGDYYKGELVEKGIDRYVQFAPRVSFHDSLIEINAASVLILIQRAGTETQIPGKAYEYLKSERPIVVIAPRGSATADLMEQYSDSGVIVSEEPKEIASFIESCLNGKMPSNFKRDISMHARNLQSKKYVELVREYVG